MQTVFYWKPEQVVKWANFSFTWNALKDENCEFILRHYKPNRSKRQNNLYHAWVEMISDHTWYTHIEWHEEFKDMFLESKRIRKPTKKRWWRKEEKTTKTLKTDEFTIFLKKIQDFALTYAWIVLPVPWDEWFSPHFYSL